MSQPLNFQQVILKLHQFWADQGCLIWEPYNVTNGAGTYNPATTLRVLGPEPWRVAYVEPSVRPDDGRFGDNPNRMQKFYQYQVILKPDPGDPQELYLQSLEALGISRAEHDIRFVEDNWESPALGAWGLGWEVWLDGQEITQFTYFQQAGGLNTEPVSVEITYGIERIVSALQGKDTVWNIDWTSGISYGDVLLEEEIEHCNYYFNIADVDALMRTYDTFEAEMRNALDGGAVIDAYDYVLKCSHLFNILDTRGAIGVTERASYFRRMRDMTRAAAHAFLAKREDLGFPLVEKMKDTWGVPLPEFTPSTPPAPTDPGTLLLEIGVEELPAHDVDDVLAQLQAAVPTLFDDLRLDHDGIAVYATPRRIAVMVSQLAAKQRDEEFVAKGPPADRAFKDGEPTKAAIGFARGKGIPVEELKVEEIDGGRYVTAQVRNEGQPATHVLMDALPKLIGDIKFGKSMRWNATNITFSRPIRWIVALFDDIVIPFQFAGVNSGNVTRGLRPNRSPERAIDAATAYHDVLQAEGVVLDINTRREAVLEQARALAAEVNGEIPLDPGLLAEITNLIEAPTAMRGAFDEKYLALPRDVLVTVMRKHQRYFPVQDADGQLLPYFIFVRNGGHQHADKVIHGNEQVLKARFADADYFYNQDLKTPLADRLPRLETLVFQEKLGSMRDKNERIVSVVDAIGDLLGIDTTQTGIAQRAAHVVKADLATSMVVEMTSLQGIMGREYALREDYPPEVAQAIFEHWLPRGADDMLPQSRAGVILAIADKLDSLVGLFAAGLAPKSTSDPYGLRRAALGIVQILVDGQYDVNLRQAIDIVAAAQPLEVSAATKDQLLDFIRGRLDVWFQETTTASGAPRDVINAVLAEQYANPYRALVGIAELHQWVQRDDWEHILDNFARCVRITRAEGQQYPINPDLFENDHERALYDAYQQAAAKLTLSSNVDAFLSAFAPVVPVIESYFDEVMVNVDDHALRQNRLGVLQAISALQTNRADLSELTGF